MSSKTNSIAPADANSEPVNAPPMGERHTLMGDMANTLNLILANQEYQRKVIAALQEELADLRHAYDQAINQLAESTHTHLHLTPRVVGAKVRLYHPNEDIPEDVTITLSVIAHKPAHPVHGELELIMTDESGHHRHITPDRMNPFVMDALLSAIRTQSVECGLTYGAGISLMTRQPIDTSSVSIDPTGPVVMAEDNGVRHIASDEPMQVVPVGGELPAE